jgi:plastocyanin
MVLTLGFSAVLLGGVPAAAGGGCVPPEHTSYARGADTVTVQITGCEFSPTVLFVDPGTTVKWENHDVFPHTVTGQGLTLNGDTFLEKGEGFNHRFGDSGIYPYACVLHPGMTAAVVVGDIDSTKKGAQLLRAGFDLPPGSARSPTGPGAWLLAAAGLLVAISAFVVGRRRAIRQ